MGLHSKPPQTKDNQMPNAKKVGQVISEIMPCHKWAFTIDMSIMGDTLLVKYEIH